METAVSGPLLCRRPWSPPSPSVVAAFNSSSSSNNSSNSRRRRYLLSSQTIRLAKTAALVKQQHEPCNTTQLQKKHESTTSAAAGETPLFSLCKSAILFLGSSVFLLAAGLSSSRAAYAQNQSVATVAPVETTATNTEQSSTGEQSEREEFDAETKEELNQAIKLIREDNVPELIKLLNRLMVKLPHVLEIHFMLAQVYDSSGDLESAVKIYQDVLSVEPLSLRALERLAVVSSKQGKDVEFIRKIAEDAAAKAASENQFDENVAFRLLIAKTLTIKGELREALQVYQQLSKDAPTDYRPHLCQGLVCCALGDLEEAEYRFRIFNRLCPEDCLDRDVMEEEIKFAREEAGDIRHKKTLK